MECLNVQNKRPAVERKEMGNKKQTSNEIITIQTERERYTNHNGREQSCRINGKKRTGGDLDNRAGDSRTIAALFSIRHYLIHRVAGLIVPGGYFQGRLCVGHRQYSLQPPQREPALLFSPLFVFYSALNCGWLRTNCLWKGKKRGQGTTFAFVAH